MGKTFTCAFCPAPIESGEHIWDDWFGRASRSNLFRFRVKGVDGTEKVWKSKSLNHKTKVVCAPCNNEWMSDLTNRTKSIAFDMGLSAKERKLDHRECSTIAAFGFMKAIVADHSHDNRKPFFSYAERRSFRESLSIPAGVQIWLACLGTAKGLFKAYYTETAFNEPQRIEINVFTYSLGHLCFQVATCRWKRKSHKKYRPPLFLTPDQSWNDVTVQCCPVIEPTIIWPPPAILGDQIVERFVHRFESLTRSF
ncbi:MAG TPA: hypothetical protein VFO34_15175 [Candidatus Acidoferrales bacterium]|nr:hypothetical protein [Candidatus Acidoferrales bacterium]